MIEEMLLNYGALGACMLIFTGFFYRYYSDTKKFQEKIIQIIENNTIALTKFYEMARGCSAKRNI